MAAVKQRLRRGAYDFAHKTCSRYLMKSQNKRDKSTIKASSLWVGCHLGNIQNGEVCGPGNAADRVTDGVYARVTPLLGTVNDVWGDVTGYVGHNKTQAKNVGRKLSLYSSNVQFMRTCTFDRGLKSLCIQPLRWGHGQTVFIRAYCRDNGFRSEPLFKSKTGYYEILEVSSTATQAQIKTAYYKQSFVYHPDRNAGSETATLRFSEISEAYTVLGNKALRKKYDRGLLSQADLVATARPSGKDTAGGTFKQQTGGRRSVMGADSRGGGVFDFDKFFKAHYNEQLKREKDIRVRKEEMLKKKQQTTEEKALGGMFEIGVGFMLVLVMVLVLSLKRR